MSAIISEHPGGIPALTLGWRLQMSLRQAGLNVQDMAEELGVSRTSLSRWMNDRGTPPRAVYLKQWALVTGVPFEWIAHGTAPETTPVRRAGAGGQVSTIVMLGAPSGTRTPNPLIKSQLLCQLS